MEATYLKDLANQIRLQQSITSVETAAAPQTNRLRHLPSIDNQLQGSFEAC